MVKQQSGFTLIELMIVVAIIALLAAGFIPAVIFAWAYELTAEGIKKEKDVDRTQSIAPSTGRKLDFTIIGILAAAVVILLVDRFTGPGSIETTAETKPPIEAVEASRDKSIAVLPFVNMSSDAEQEYFSDGISEEILNSLAKVKELKVAGRTSSFAFKGQNQDLRQIGQTLGVENILEGSVRKAGTTVRITAQLIQVEDGFHLWSETYERELTDVFAIQDEIAQAILVQLKAHLIDQGLAVQTSTRTDTKAYDLYLLARERIYERKPESIKFAADLLDEALLVDDKYAPALALRGIATLMMSETNYGDINKDLADQQAMTFFDQARELDPGLAEVWAGIGLYHTTRPREHEQAITALRKALAINPNMIDASNWLAIALGNGGYHAESRELAEQIIERDPLYPPAAGNVINEWNQTGQQARSLALIEKIRPFMPDAPLLLRSEATTYYSLGEMAKGFLLAEEAYLARPEDSVIRNAFVFGLFITRQHERLLEVEGDAFRNITLRRLNRMEEATMLAYEKAGSGNIRPLIFTLLETSREQDLIDFIEDRWTDLDALQADYPPGESGYGLMSAIAQAYSHLGNEEKFNDAMRRVRKALDNAVALGIQASFFYVQEAEYQALAGNHDSAIDDLQRAMESGFVSPPRLADDWAALEVLESYPRYQEIQTSMIEHLQAARAALGLDPASI